MARTAARRPPIQAKRFHWMWLVAMLLSIANIGLLVYMLVTQREQFRSDSWALSAYGWASAISAVTFASVGALIAMRRPDNRLGELCLVIGILGTLTSLFSLAAFLLPVSSSAAWFELLSRAHFGLIFPLSLTLLALLFPTGRLLSRRWRWILVCGIVSALATAASLFVRPTLWVGNNHFDLPNPVYLGPPFDSTLMEARANSISEKGSLIQLVVFSAALGSLLVRWRSGNSIERQQLKWLILGIAASLCVMLTGLAVGLLNLHVAGLEGFDILMIGIMLLWLAIPIAIGIAIVRHRLFDIDLIISRTLVYAALTAFVVGGYALIVGAAGALFHVQGNPLPALLATGLVAVAFSPVRAYLQRGANRLMYGQRDEPYSVVSQLGRQLETTSGPDAVAAAIVHTLGSSLKLPFVSIILTTDEPEIAHAVGPALSNPPARADLLVFPLSYHGEALGELRVLPQVGEQISASQRALLGDIGRQAGIALHAARATADLQQSRERLVNAREEERRRLRRDLHDRLGPTLASLYQRIDTASYLLASDPATATRLLEDTKIQMKAVVGDIRRLVYSLRPPVLDELGLLAAIREECERLPGGARVPGLELALPLALPPLPAAIEVAAYYIVTEAVTNVIKHAQANHCRVQLSMEASRLNVCICDNGVGIMSSTRSGIGFQSMRERAAELGGSVRIAPHQPCGTIVQAELPIHSAR